MQPRLVPILSLLFCVVSMSGNVCAQPAANATGSQPREESDDLIRESDLKIRIKDDESGNLVAVPGFTLQAFRELLALQNRIKEQQAALPKAVFTGSIELDGDVDPAKQFARLEATYRIRLTSRPEVEGESWTAIPLRLDDSFLDVGALQHEEEGEVYITRDGSAYLCWIRAAADSTHTIRVPIKVPLTRTGTTDSLKLILPNMASKLRLTLVGGMIEAFCPSGRNNVSRESRGDTTIVTVEGGGGELDLAWQERGKALPHALEATCATTVHVHGNHIWSAADLKVRSRGEAIDSFVVRLPDGMELTSRSDSDFQISPLPPSEGSSSQFVLVKRLGGATSLIDVHLEAALPKTTDDTQRRTVQLAGFAVQDAVREWGSVEVMLDGNWSPTWHAGQFVQRVAVTDDPARQQRAAARFLYDRQPYSLRLELSPKQTRVAFTTTYVVDVADDSIQLDARISYATNDAKVDSLSFKMPGWTIDSVSPQDSLAKPFTFDDKGILTLPVAGGATEFDIHVRASRGVEQDATHVSFDLPRPSDSTMLPNGTLTVLASDNVELTPEPASMKWLVQDTRTPSSELPNRIVPPLLFREELSTESDEAAHFVARRRIRQREMAVVVNSDAELEADFVRVRQSILATVTYVPLAKLTIAIPKTVMATGTLRLTSGVQELAYQTTSERELDRDTAAVDSVNGAESETIEAIVSLPSPVTGEVLVEAAFEVPLEEILGNETLQIPLVQPAGDEATGSVTNLLAIRADENTAVTIADEMWTRQPNADPQSNGGRELRLRSTGVATVALVQRSVVESHRSGNTAIPRVWIQTWLTPTNQRDRVCFQLLSEQPLVHIQLPSTCRSENLRLLVDGEPPVDLVDHGDLSLTVTLSEEQAGRLVSLEMCYLSKTTGGSRVGVAVPTIVDADPAEWVYWQLVLPRSEHLAWIPSTLTSELVWQREQWYWGRRGRLEQRSLEELVGASTQEPVSPNTNRYLFSSTGSINSVAFVKVNRRTVMFVASGLALVCVLPFIYLPVLRQPGVFFVMGVVLFATALTYPEQTAGLGQAGAIGLGLAIVAYALHTLLSRTQTAPVTARGSVYITSDSQANSTPAPVPESSSRATTATAPAHLQVARAEGES